MGIHEEFNGFRYERFTELPKKLTPLMATAPPEGPEEGETVTSVPKPAVKGLPNPVTKS
jgi:hypothetical protein